MKAHFPRPPRAARTYGLVLALLGCNGGSDDRSTSAPDRRPSGDERAQDAHGASEIDAPPMNAAANDARVRAPMDATPSPDGKRVYYTALQRDAAGDDVPGVFAVAADGSGEIETLAVGGMLDRAGRDQHRPRRRAAVRGRRRDRDRRRERRRRDRVARRERRRSGGRERNGRLRAARDGDRRHGAARTALLHRADPESGQRRRVPRSRPRAAPSRRLAANARDRRSGRHRGRRERRRVRASTRSRREGHAGVVRIRDGEARVDARRGIGVGFPAGIAITRDGGTVLVSALDPQHAP